MRYFARLAYLGTAYHGWQSQKNTDQTVQQVIERAFSTLSRQEVKVVGCGRTDTGVHASDYVLHFDSDYDFTNHEFKVNSILPEDIAVYKIWAVNADAHARYDATMRTYHYKLHTRKNPFIKGLSYRYFGGLLDVTRLNQAAALLIGEKDFTALAKTGSDVVHHRCQVSECYWQKKSGHDYEFTISANRFLRGMVRLSVGMCLHVYEEKMSLSDVKKAMKDQSPLPKPFSVPAHGLYLSKIEY